jgi:hypothetical protein
MTFPAIRANAADDLEKCLLQDILRILLIPQNAPGEIVYRSLEGTIQRLESFYVSRFGTSDQDVRDGERDSHLLTLRCRSAAERRGIGKIAVRVFAVTI